MASNPGTTFDIDAEAQRLFAEARTGRVSNTNETLRAARAALDEPLDMTPDASAPASAPAAEGDAPAFDMEAAARELLAQTPLPPRAAAPAAKADDSNFATRALVRGTLGAGARIQSLWDAEAGSAWQQEIEAKYPREVQELLKADSASDKVVGFAERVIESVPEMVAVAGAATGAVLAAPATATAATLTTVGLGAGWLASTPFQTGGNLMRQVQDTGKVDYPTAIGFGVAQGALDALLPAGVGKGVALATKTAIVGAVAKKLAQPGVVSRVAKVGGAAVMEAATEATQGLLEQWAGTPENIRILTNPKNAAEAKKQEQLLDELVEAAIVGGGAGATISTGGQALEANAARRARNRQKGEIEAAGLDAAALRDPALAKPVDVSDFDDFLNRLDMTDTYLAKLAQAESAGKPNAKNILSSATGIYQFTDDTWWSLMQKHRPDLAKRGKAGTLALRRDPRLQGEMIVHFTNENRAALQRAGLPVANATLGIMHRFGQGGGVEVLKVAKQNPDARLDSFLSGSVMKANPDLKNQTAGGIIQWYEQRLGQGLTFTGVNRNMPAFSLRDVQTNTDRTGTPFMGLGARDAATASAEALERSLNTLLVAPDTEEGAPSTVPDAARDALRKSLEDASGGTTEGVAKALVAIADGDKTVAVEGLRSSDVQTAAELAVSDLGLTPANRERGSYTMPSAPLFAVENQSTPRWRLAKAVRDAFMASNASARMTPTTGGEFMSNAMRAYSEFADKQTAWLTTEAGKSKGAKRRTYLSMSRQAAVARETLARAAEGIETLMTPKSTAGGMTDADARLAVIAAANLSKNTKLAPQLRKALASFEQALLAYDPNMASKRGNKRRGGSAAFLRHVSGMVTPLQDTNGVPLANIISKPVRVRMTVGLNNLHVAVAKLTERNAAEITKTEAVRYKAGVEQRALQTERMAQEKALWEQAQQTVRDAQLRAKSDNIRRNNPTVLQLLTDDPSTWTATAPRALSVSALRKLRDNRYVPGGIAQWLARNAPLMHFLPLRVAGRAFIDDLFNNVRVNGSSHSVTGAAMSAAHSGDSIRKSTIKSTTDLLVKDAVTALADAVKDGRYTAEQGRTAQQRAAEAISYLMATATYHGFRLFSLDGTRVTPQTLAAISLPSYNRDNDPNAHLVVETTNDAGETEYAYREEVLPHMMRAAQELDEMSPAMQQLYLKTRDIVRQQNTALLLSIVNNRRLELGLAPVPDLESAAAVLSAEADTEQGLKLPEDDRKGLLSIIRHQLDGDYFSLERQGNFSLYARQTVLFRAATEKQALDAYKAAKKGNVHLRPLTDTKSAVAEPDGAGYVVRAEIPYYEHFETEEQAETARAALVALQNGLPPERAGITDPNMASFRPDHVDAVFSLTTEAEPRGASGLTDAQGAVLRDIATRADGAFNRELRNILLEMLPDRQMAATLKTRENVLGAPPNFITTMQTRTVRLSNQLAETRARPQLRVVFEQMKQQIDQTKAQAGAATSTAERKRLQQLHAAQQEAFAHLTKRVENEVRPLLAGLGNSTMSKLVTVMFLSGMSHVVMNTTQVFLYGTGQFAARYGARGAWNLQKALGRATKLTSTAMVKGAMRTRSPEQTLAYFSDSQMVDIRHFSKEGVDPRVTDPNQPPTAPARFQPADPAGLKLEWESVANSGLGRAGQFGVALDGQPEALFISEFEFDSYMDGSISWEELRMISKAHEDRHLGSTFYEETAPIRITAGDGFAEQAADKAGRAMAGTSQLIYDVATFLPGVVEYGNRLAVVLATLESEQQRRNADNPISEAEYSTYGRAADELNSIINVDYSPVNRSTWQRKAGVLMQFTTFPISMAAEAALIAVAMARKGGYAGYTRREAAVAGATTFLLVGTIAGGRGATPFFVDLAGQFAASAVGMVFGDEEDSNDEDAASWADHVAKWGSEAGTERAMRATFGDFWTDVWFKGPVSMGTGVALQERMGQHLPPVRIPDNLFSEGSEGLAELVLNLTGPIGGLTAQAFEAYSIAEQQGGWRTAEAFTPKAVRDILRAFRYTDEGITDRTGKVQFTPEQLAEIHGQTVFLTKFMGFSLTTEEDMWEARNLQREQDRKRNAAADAIRRDIETATPEEREELYDRIQKLRRTYPDTPLKADAIGKGIRQRRVDEAGRQREGGLDPRRRMMNEEIRAIQGSE